MRGLATPARRRPVILGQSQQGRRHKPDYLLILISTILLVIGLVVVYAISPGLGAQRNVGQNYFVSKQVIAIALGLLTFIAASHVPPRSWSKLQKPLIVLALAAAAATQLFGEEINGASRWVHIGGLSFQAVELIKFALIVWLASFLTEKIKAGQLQDKERTLKPLLYVLGGLGIVVAVLQSDLGSMGVVVAIMAAMVFVAGISLKKAVLFGGVILIATTLAISMSSYRRDRLTTFLNPESDCQTTGYQACQALIAVGSGGMFGTGIDRSVQAYGYLPEAANDSIFAILAEMFGFLGMCVVVGLFVGLFTRLIRIIERAPDIESRLLVVGVLAWLSTQALINIGAMIGLLPLKGITLPFISYGGTSLIFVTGAVGMAFGVSRYTTYGVNAELDLATDTVSYGSKRRGAGASRGTYGTR